jgi:hypothetical protein
MNSTPADKGDAMQQFVRVQQGSDVIPGLVNGTGMLDLRPLVSDITPQTIAGGALNDMNAARLEPITGEACILSPIFGTRQIPATRFNYKKHIEEPRPGSFLGSSLGQAKQAFPPAQCHHAAHL